MVARDRQRRCLRPFRAVEHLGARHELPVGLAAEDDDLVADNCGGSGGAGVQQVRERDPGAIV